MRESAFHYLFTGFTFLLLVNQSSPKIQNGKNPYKLNLPKHLLSLLSLFSILRKPHPLFLINQIFHQYLRKKRHYPNENGQIFFINKQIKTMELFLST